MWEKFCHNSLIVITVKTKPLLNVHVQFESRVKLTFLEIYLWQLGPVHIIIQTIHNHHEHFSPLLRIKLGTALALALAVAWRAGETKHIMFVVHVCFITVIEIIFIFLCCFVLLFGNTRPQLFMLLHMKVPVTVMPTCSAYKLLFVPQKV